MSASFAQWVALVGAVAIGALFIAEVRRWRGPRSVVGRKQRVLRVALMLLLESLFVLTFAGPWVTSQKDPITELIYWTVCVALGLTVIVLALYDLKAVARGYAVVNRRMLDDLKEDERR